MAQSEKIFGNVENEKSTACVTLEGEVSAIQDAKKVRKRMKRDSLVVTKERNKKNLGKRKESAPEGIKVEIVDA